MILIFGICFLRIKKLKKKRNNFFRKNKWSTIVNSIGTFDCILSLVRYAQTSSLKMCCPEFVFDAPIVLLN